MKIFLNGDERNLIRSSNICELVNELGLHKNTVLIEHNGIALHKDEWDSVFLKENDRIEILRVVAGG